MRNGKNKHIKTPSTQMNIMFMLGKPIQQKTQLDGEAYIFSLSFNYKKSYTNK